MENNYFSLFQNHALFFYHFRDHALFFITSQLITFSCFLVHHITAIMQF